MTLTKTFLEFKTKVQQMHTDEGLRPYIQFKRKVTKGMTDLKPHKHSYYNSDLMDGMVQRAYDKAISGREIGYMDTPREWAYVDSLPTGVTIDTSKFMAVVRVEIEC